MFEEAVSLLSIWASMNNWLTPTVLFVLLNFMIGTIFVTSGFTSHKPQSQSQPQPQQQHHHHQQQHNHQFEQNFYYQQPQIQTQTSVIQRLKSLNFYAFIHSTPQQPQQHEQQNPATETHHDQQQQQEVTNEKVQILEEEVGPISEEEEGPTMDEIYKLITQKGNSQPHYGRQNSDTKPSAGELPKKLPAKIKKLASDLSPFNHFGAVDEEILERENANNNGGHDERETTEVDARADDFINRFREQLKMQRMESIFRSKQNGVGLTFKTSCRIMSIWH